MWAELQQQRQSSELDQHRKALRKEVTGVLMEHFPHSFTPRREKPEAVIGLDIGKEKQRMEELLQTKMREMEVELQSLKDQLKRTEITQRWVELEQERQSKCGASAIELFDRSKCHFSTRALDERVTPEIGYVTTILQPIQLMTGHLEHISFLVEILERKHDVNPEMRDEFKKTRTEPSTML